MTSHCSTSDEIITIINDELNSNDAERIVDENEIVLPSSDDVVNSDSDTNEIIVNNGVMENEENVTAVSV